ncbi:NmrA family NAD(P)-binding protein [Curtobacterium flaccumfaciens pv. flaccumfaciens]|uniref:NmrA family NAD(P)-binding protein n=1 Tax=Curtobacterium aurantiacum TaxID=3236919 RepID=A0ABS5VBK7_9MICO|nr:NmrA family NAD(P)-binding protein [Curtobacterium flaccumfaciens pv. flaccumfaciens]MBT1586200.1 NmrA family NAD(P)-binding protein [Curtobacterium flaccumfaciens pv. flaccumfaciens]
MGEIVAVTGVTGDVGGKTAELLRAAGVTVRAVVRRPEQVDALRARGIDGRLADLGDEDALTAALEGVDRFFLVTPVSQRQREQGAAGVRAAQRAGVARIVQLSGGDAAEHSPHVVGERRLAHRPAGARERPGVDDPPPVVVHDERAALGAGDPSGMVPAHHGPRGDWLDRHRGHRPDGRAGAHRGRPRQHRTGAHRTGPARRAGCRRRAHRRARPTRARPAPAEPRLRRCAAPERGARLAGRGAPAAVRSGRPPRTRRRRRDERRRAAHHRHRTAEPDRLGASPPRRPAGVTRRAGGDPGLQAVDRQRDVSVTTRCSCT